MKILATLSAPQQHNGETVATVTLHTARSGRPCGEFLIVRLPDGRIEYRAVDGTYVASDGDVSEFGDVAATVRRQHFQRTYDNLRDKFHGKAA